MFQACQMTCLDDLSNIENALMEILVFFVFFSLYQPFHFSSTCRIPLSYMYLTFVGTKLKCC